MSTLFRSQQDHAPRLWPRRSRTASSGSSGSPTSPRPRTWPPTSPRRLALCARRAPACRSPSSIGQRSAGRHDHLHEHRRRSTAASRSARPGIARSVQRTPSTPNASACCLRHAFESSGLHRRRVPHPLLQHRQPPGHRAPGRQARRRPAQPFLGRDGTLRDTCVYSIIAAEWPTVRAHLDWQLARPR